MDTEVHRRLGMEEVKQRDQRRVRIVHHHPGPLVR